MANRFLTRYMHLAGPGLVSLSPGMSAFLGERIGLMNDTGNSVLDHLHFSIHDQTVPFPGGGTPGTTPVGAACGGAVTRGASVRPTPMEGGTLNDNDGGRCVRSTNEESNVIRLPPGCGRVIVDIIRGAFGRD
jgi:murein DD-endopeptidase MepM/ murein hydrolase activator NlpD